MRAVIRGGWLKAFFFFNSCAFFFLLVLPFAFNSPLSKSFPSRPTTVVAPVAPCQPRLRSGWTTAPPPASLTPTSKRCRPRTPAAAPRRTAWPPTPERRRWRHPKRRARRAAAEATEWGRGVAASPSRPRGNPFPLPWSPWQPPPHLLPPPRGRFTKVPHSDDKMQHGSA